MPTATPGACILMAFPDRLAQLRRNSGMTQQDLAASADISLPQLKRYETGKSEPTLDVIRRLAVALRATSDDLVFGPGDRAPSADLLLEFEAISKFSDEEKRMIKGVLKGLILKHESERF